MKVYIVIHNFVSHDMFVPQWAKEGNPTVFGTYSTRAEAKKHIRPNADDYIQVHEIQVHEIDEPSRRSGKSKISLKISRVFKRPKWGMT